MNKIANALKFVWKNTRVWLIVSISVMLLIFTATMVATQVVFLRNTISTVMGGERRVLVSGDASKYQYYTTDNNGFKQYKTDSKFESKAETLNEANKFNEMIVEEGIVLLKNENDALPLPQEAKISVFGKNSINLVYGGSGSSGGNNVRAVSLYDSLGAAGFIVNPTLKTLPAAAERKIPLWVRFRQGLQPEKRLSQGIQAL